MALQGEARTLSLELECEGATRQPLAAMNALHLGRWLSARLDAPLHLPPRLDEFCARRQRVRLLPRGEQASMRGVRGQKYEVPTFPDPAAPGAPP